MNPVKIITYHYVRPIAQSRYPNIKGLEVDVFRKQIEYLAKTHNIVTMQQVVKAFYEEEDLPKNAALLVFDDGYADHYNYVLPILMLFGVQGSFFVPVKPIMERKLLDVNKIHLILNYYGIGADLKRDLLLHIMNATNCGIPYLAIEELEKLYSEDNRFDDADTMFVKRFLQKDKTPYTKQIIDNWLLECTNTPEVAHANELYLTLDQILVMMKNGMYIGGHTNSHPHLGSIEKKQQAEEFYTTKIFLDALGCDAKYYTMSYPYGSHNEFTKMTLPVYNFRLGIGIDYGLANPATTDKFNVPRIDCNDLQKEMDNA